MKYNFLQSLVPEGEHFDESAILNEGGWMSIKHLDLINSRGTELQSIIDRLNQSIADKDAATEAMVTLHASAVEALNGTIADNATLVAELQAAAEASTQTITNHESTIAALQAQVKQLGAKSSGNGTNLSTAGDQTQTAAETTVPAATSALPRYDSADHPANKGADSFLRSQRVPENIRL